jgi:hypothetical protein
VLCSSGRGLRASKLRPIYDLNRRGLRRTFAASRAAQGAQLLHKSRYNRRTGPLIGFGGIIGAIGCRMVRRVLTVEGKDLALLLNCPLLLVAYRETFRVSRQSPTVFLNCRFMNW